MACREPLTNILRFYRESIRIEKLTAQPLLRYAFSCRIEAAHPQL
jgi:hypothetical protein